MKRQYIEQVNGLLEGFHFNTEIMGSDRSLAFAALQNGMQHIYGAAFCAGDNETASQLKPLLLQILDNEVPQPLCVEAI